MANVTPKAVTWFHFSDLHASAADAYNRQRVLAALWDDLKRHLDSGRVPDFVCFTGDIARAGKPEEYSLALREFFEPLLELTKVPRERILVVPGNHDCDWAASRCLRYPGGQSFSDEITELLSNPDTARMYLCPQSAYRSFCGELCGRAGPEPEGGMGYSRRWVIGNYAVSVIGLNSAWLSGPLIGKPAVGRKGAPEEGTLAVGEVQLTKVMEGVRESDLTLALSHHLPECLHREDREATERLLLRHCQFVLCGHMHRNRVRVTQAPRDDLLYMPTGCLYETRDYPNSYMICTYTFATGTADLLLRRYTHEADEWQQDAISTGEKDNGRLYFQVSSLRGITKFVQEEGLPLRSHELLSPPAVPGRSARRRHLSDYRLVFTDSCLADVKSLGLTRQDLYALVEAEFFAHQNYFIFDLDYYPLPVKSELIVYLDKTGAVLTFRSVARCTADLAMLSAWHDILATYRAATRLAYRLDPSALLASPGLVGRVVEIHDRIEARLIRYFEQFHEQRVGPIVLGEETAVGDMLSSGRPAPPGSPVLSPEECQIAFVLREARDERRQARTICYELDRGETTADQAMGHLALALERSLQLLHKVILGHSPVQSQRASGDAAAAP